LYAITVRLALGCFIEAFQSSAASQIGLKENYIVLLKLADYRVVASPQNLVVVPVFKVHELRIRSKTPSRKKFLAINIVHGAYCDASVGVEVVKLAFFPCYSEGMLEVGCHLRNRLSIKFRGSEYFRGTQRNTLVVFYIGIDIKNVGVLFIDRLYILVNTHSEHLSTVSHVDFSEISGAGSHLVAVEIYSRQHSSIKVPVKAV
jgi:hypothetical protein